MKTTFFKKKGAVNGLPTSGLERVLYVSDRVGAYNSGDPYPLAYLVANTTLKLVLAKHWTDHLASVKSSLYSAYLELTADATADATADVTADAKDVLQEAVVLLYAHSGDYREAQHDLRRWIAAQKNGWEDNTTVFYEDFTSGEIKRLPSALISTTVDGSGAACTVSSYSVEDVTAQLDKIPLSKTERRYLSELLSGCSVTDIASRYGVAVAVASKTISTARAKARMTLTK